MTIPRLRTGLGAFLLALALMLLLALPSAAQGTGRQPLGTLWDATLPDVVYGAAVSDDGSLIVFGGRDGVLHATDAEGAELWTEDLGGTIRHVAVSADGSRIAAATETRVITMLDRQGATLWTHNTRMPPVGLGISDDGEVVAVGEEIKTRVTVLEGASGEVRWSQDFTVRIESAAVSGDGSKVFTGSRDARLTAYDAVTGEQQTVVTLSSILYAISAPGDGNLVITGSDMRKVEAVDLSTGEVLWQYSVADRVTRVATSPDLSLIAAGVWDGKVHLLSREGELQQIIEGGSRVGALAMSADGSVVVAGTEAGRLFAVNVASAKAAGTARARMGLLITVLVVAAVGVSGVAFGWYVRNNPTGRVWWAPRAHKLRRAARLVWRGRLGYLFLAPTFAFLVVFAYYPSVMGLGLGFTEWTPGQIRPPKWVGLYNYQLVFANPNTGAAIRNVAILTITDLMKTLIGPLLVAELIFTLSRPRQQYSWRTLYIVPLVVPGVATILMWNSIFDPNLGLINNTLFALGLASPQNPPTWFGDRMLALPSLIFIGFPWIGAFPLLIYYGGLIAISTEIFDAAKVDGATGLQRLWQIDVPILLPQIRLLSVLSVIGSLQQFGLIILTTRGGPGNATTVPAFEMYVQGLVSGRYGYAAAMASLLFVVIMAITLLNLRLVREAPTPR